MSVTDSLQKIKLPLSVTVVAVAATLSGLFTSWSWLEATYAHRSDFEKYQVSQAINFEKYQNQVEQRILTQQKFQLENEILKLEIKMASYPEKFDAVDKGVLNKAQEQLREINFDLKVVKEQYVKLISGRL